MEMNKKNSSAPVYLTTHDVAHRLSVSRMEVYRYIHSGRLRAFNRSNGKRRPVWRVRADDLAEFEKLGSTFDLK